MGRLKRIRLGEGLALVGAGLAIASLFVRWYENPSGNLDAWDTFGPAIVLLLIAVVASLTMVASAALERGSTAWPVASAVWSVTFALLAVIAMIVRVLERPDHATMNCIGSWLALAGSVLMLAGSWQVIRDERPSLYPRQPLEPRPQP